MTTPTANEFAEVDSFVQELRANRAQASAKKEKVLDALPERQAEPEPEAVELALETSAKETSELAWTVLDIAAQKGLGQKYALTEQEKALLVEKTVPVMRKWFPTLQVSPEWALLGTVGAVYGMKAGLLGGESSEESTGSAKPNLETGKSP